MTYNWTDIEVYRAALCMTDAGVMQELNCSPRRKNFTTSSVILLFKDTRVLVVGSSTAELHPEQWISVVQRARGLGGDSVCGVPDFADDSG